MKRLFLITGIALMMVLSLTGLVLADGGPHGDYTATTDACAGCHRAHTAIGPRLLLYNSTYDLCVSCHGNAGAGADSNVLDGVWLAGRNPTDTTGDAETADGASLLGGGFVNYQGVAVTSSHDPTDTEIDAWGYGVARGTVAALAGADTLSCASCHDPHGSTNYRIIPETVNGVVVAVAQVDEGAAKDYDEEHWDTGTSDFCAACHDDYHQTLAGQGSTLDGASYTHRVDMTYDWDGNPNPETTALDGLTLPLAESGTNNTVVCMTCHLPHGTAAVMTGFADGAFDPDGPQGPIPSGDSALLRLDNRGVCQVCHRQ